MMADVVSLAGWIIDKTNTASYRMGTLVGWKHPTVDGNMIKAVGGMASLAGQAREMEHNPALYGRISFGWTNLGSDIKQIDYDVGVIPLLCEIEGIEDPRMRQRRGIDGAKKCLEEMLGMGDTKISPYYAFALGQLEKGNTGQLANIEDDAFIRCLNKIAGLSEPVWKRNFSADVFGNSKTFERQYQGRVVEALRHSPLYEDDMSADEVLAAHNINSYSQTLEWKGPLVYKLDHGETLVDSGKNVYGTVINAQTLNHAAPEALPGVGRIMTIENKANYESMAYDDGTLYIFCHGFFSPKEMRFLKKLNDIAAPGTKFCHWGDMDFGGIRIFKFIEDNLFPDLQPYRMGKADFDGAKKKSGMVLSDAKRHKLEKIDAGKLAELKNCILESGVEVEQEQLAVSASKRGDNAWKK